MTTTTLLFTDIVDSTKVVESLGDARAAQVMATHDRRARDLIERHHGREIARTDGFFLLFDATAEAAAFALAYHQAIADLELRARVGLHVGPVILRENASDDVTRGAKATEVEGLATPFAARIMGLAMGGQTLLSASARAALGDALPEGSEVESHGHYRLKGIEEPAEIFELGLRAASAFAPPADADKAYRVVRAGEFWRPVREIRHNVPAARDAFVGRSAELRAFAARLDDGARLLTVLGPGGTGKTRFVCRYAQAWLGDWPGGIFFCDLSEARSLDGIHYAVSMALDVPLGKGDTGVQLGHAIAGRGRCLLLLDNFEQVLEHAGATVGRWIDRAADASFAVTSRELLHLPGEEIFAIEPLPIDVEAIELFAVRAHAQQPEFVLSQANAAAVAEVVRLLDGLPLAIELAAARVRVFTPVQLVERLQDRFQLLAGARGAAARQATLRAAIDWSWELLAPWEQSALAQCSVFEGGFTLEAVESVLDLARWPEAPPPMDVVQALVDKSLLRTWTAAERGRYDIDEHYFAMYISIREYAVEKLAAGGPGATRAAEVQHGKYFSGFGTEDSLDALFGHDGIRRLRAVALELENLVAACRRAVARDDGDTAVATCRAAWEVLDRRGPVALGAMLSAQVLALEGIDASQRAAVCVIRARASRRVGHTAEAETLLMQAQAHAREARDRRSEGVALYQLGLLHNAFGSVEAARNEHETALVIFRELGNRRLEGVAVGSLGNLLCNQGRMDEARVMLETGLAIYREQGDRRAEGAAIGNLAVMHHDLGRVDEAEVHYESSIAIMRETGDRLAECITLGNLGTLHNDLGRLERARVYFEDSLAISREIGDRTGEGVSLGNLGKLAVDQGRMDDARRDYTMALDIVRETRNRRDEGVVLGNLGALHYKQGRFVDARIHYEAALAVHREVGNRRFEGQVLGNLGELLAKLGRIGEARAALNEGDAVLREIGDPLDLALLRCLRGQAERTAGNFDVALSLLAEAEAAATALHAEPDAELRQEVERLRALLA